MKLGSVINKEIDLINNEDLAKCGNNFRKLGK